MFIISHCFQLISLLLSQVFLFVSLGDTVTDQREARKTNEESYYQWPITGIDKNDVGLAFGALWPSQTTDPIVYYDEKVTPFIHRGMDIGSHPTVNGGDETLIKLLNGNTDGLNLNYTDLNKFLVRVMDKGIISKIHVDSEGWGYHVIFEKDFDGTIPEPTIKWLEVDKKQTNVLLYDPAIDNEVKNYEGSLLANYMHIRPLILKELAELNMDSYNGWLIENIYEDCNGNGINCEVTIEGKTYYVFKSFNNLPERNVPHAFPVSKGDIIGIVDLSLTKSIPHLHLHIIKNEPNTDIFKGALPPKNTTFDEKGEVPITKNLIFPMNAIDPMVMLTLSESELQIEPTVDAVTFIPKLFQIEHNNQTYNNTIRAIVKGRRVSEGLIGSLTTMSIRVHGENPTQVDSIYSEDSGGRRFFYFPSNAPIFQGIELEYDSPLTIDFFNGGDDIYTINYPFKDVAPSDWFGQEVIKLTKLEVFEKRHLFNPKIRISRAEFLKMLLKINDLSCNEVNSCPSTLPFKDVRTNDWYFDHVSYAYGNGWIPENENYYPNAGLTRAEAASLIVFSLNIQSKEPVKNKPDFLDVSPGDWFHNYVYLCRENKIIEGYNDNHFLPNKTLSRAEAAKIICNIVDCTDNRE